MQTPWKLHVLTFVVAVLLMVGGLVSWPAHAYAAYNSPSGPHYHAGPVLTESLLLNPIESLTPHTYNPPTKP